MRTLVAMATYSFNRLIMGKVEIGNFYCLIGDNKSFNRLIMGKVEIGNFYCLIGDNRILFLQKCLLNCSPLL